MRHYAFVLSTLKLKVYEHSINCLGKFEQIYNFAALGANTNLLDVEVNRSKVKVMPRPNVVKMVEAYA